MSALILVAYATRYGSTQEVAEAVAAMLREHGFDIELQPVQKVQTLERYRAVVLGTPIYIGKWHKDMQRFLARYQKALMQRTVAIFALGPISADEKEMLGSRAQLEEELAKHPWLIPVAVEMFVGKYDLTKLSFPHRLLAALPASPLHGLPASDNRDWDAIHSWARTLAEQLQFTVPKEEQK